MASSGLRPLRIKTGQLSLHFVHNRRPNAALFIKLNGSRVVGNRHIHVHRSLPRPVFEARMERQQLVDIIPNVLEDRLHDALVGAFGGREINIVGIDAGIVLDRRRLAAFEPLRIIAGHGGA